MTTDDIMLLFVFMLTVIPQVSSAHWCWHSDGANGKYFYCSAYESCCADSCCQSIGPSFYKMWYFWFCLMLALMFCSGGGYWYRQKYVHQRILYNHRSSTTTVLTMSRDETHGQSSNSHSSFMNSTTGVSSPAPPSYNRVVPPRGTDNAHAQGSVMIAPRGGVYYVSPYSGPPPSYDSVYPRQTTVAITQTVPATGGQHQTQVYSVGLGALGGPPGFQQRNSSDYDGGLF